MDQATIAEARTARYLSDIVGQSIDLKRAGRLWRGLCPFHREKSPSFYIDDEKAKFCCYGCDTHGDAIDFLMLIEGLPFKEAVEHLLGKDINLPRAQQTIRHGELTEEEDTIRRRAHAHGVWMSRKPVKGTLAAAYLRRIRGLSLRIPDQIGFVDEVYCSPLCRAVPALVAAIQDGHGQVTAIQCVFLDEKTGDAFRDEGGRRIKRTMGPMKDGAVRLAAPLEALGIAGSVEDGLTVQQVFSLPVWASCGEGRMGSVGVPDTVSRVIIFGDSDEAGQRQAAEAKRKLSLRRFDLEIDIMLPENAKDWNATL